MDLCYFLLFCALGTTIGTANGDGVPPDKWTQCDRMGDGMIRMEKNAKDLLLCYRSKLADDFGTWKMDRRFKPITGPMEQELAQKCVETDGKRGWHGLLIEGNNETNGLTFKSSFAKGLTGKLDNAFVTNGTDASFLAINLTNALLANSVDWVEFQRALPLGPFMHEFDGMALRIVAMELDGAIGTKDMAMCKAKVPNLFSPHATTVPDLGTTEPNLSTTRATTELNVVKTDSITTTAPNLFAPRATTVSHFGIDCIKADFPGNIVQFSLNISASLFDSTCVQYMKTYELGQYPDNYPEVAKQDRVDACAKVPTTAQCDNSYDLFGCFATGNQLGVANKEIAEMCQQHLANAEFSAGFRVRLCARRATEKPLIIVQSILDFSFTDQSYAITRNFSYNTHDALTEAVERSPIFFIEFGIDEKQSALRERTGGAEQAEELEKKNATIGAILAKIVEESINGSWAKSLHFVPPSDEYMKIFFQISTPNFSKRITREKDLKPYENNPNKTTPSRCDYLGDDCEPIREMFRKILEIQRCCNPSYTPNPCICAHPPTEEELKRFAVPPGESPPITPPFSNQSSDDPLVRVGGDIMYTKEQAQQLYEEYKEECAKCEAVPKKDKRRRRKRQIRPQLAKWTKFPIAIRFKKDLGNKPVNYITAVKNGIKLIMDKTCVTFTTNFTHQPEEGIEIYDAKDGWCGCSYLGHIYKWQQVSISCTDGGTVGHEFLHALGFHHEHQRDDANHFVILHPFKPEPKYKRENKTDNYGFPYDFYSIMHYASYPHDGYYDLIALDRFYQRTMRHTSVAYELPFKDAALINHLYCKDSCKGTKNECQNGGYPNPKECEQCHCPEGYGGKHCELLAENQNCVETDLPGRELEADWQTRVMSPKLSCVGGAKKCICYWRIKPKNGKKLMLKLKKVDKEALDCDHPCLGSHLELNYRKDKRARGAWLCCASQVDPINEEHINWISPEATNVDIIISAHIATDKPTKVFELTYETDAAKLVTANDCVPDMNFVERNPGKRIRCYKGDIEVPCCIEGRPCPKTASYERWGCDVLVLNGKYREVRPENDRDFGFHCLRREDQTKGFWTYRRPDKDVDPIRIDDFKCMHYEEAGIEKAPTKTEISLIDQTNPAPKRKRRNDSTQKRLNRNAKKMDTSRQNDLDQ